nr:hypothetical protein GCM10020093_004290 [Planobispora longispora]
MLLVDDRLLPRSLEDVSATPYDFGVPRVIGGVPVDHAFTGLVPDADGLVRVRVRGPEGGVEIRWEAAAMPWAQVCTGTGLGYAGLAVEPMTCPPDAFNSGTDLIVLQPGEKTEHSWTISLSEVTGGSGTLRGRSPAPPQPDHRPEVRRCTARPSDGSPRPSSTPCSGGPWAPGSSPPPS